MLRPWIAGLALTALCASAVHAASFDARRPADVARALNAHGVSGRMTREDGETLFAGTAGTANFTVRFHDCNAAATRCSTLLFVAGEWPSHAPVTADQMNQWNNWAIYCPGFVDGDHLPQVWSFMAVSARTQAADLMANMTLWKGCLTSFGKFVAGPKAYLDVLTGAAPG